MNILSFSSKMADSVIHCSFLITLKSIVNFNDATSSCRWWDYILFLPNSLKSLAQSEFTLFTFLPGQNESTISHSVIGSLNTISCNSVLGRDDTLNGCVVSHSKPPTALHWAKLTLPIVPWLQHSLFTVAHHIKGKNRLWCTHHRVTPQWTSMV